MRLAFALAGACVVAGCATTHHTSVAAPYASSGQKKLGASTRSRRMTRSVIQQMSASALAPIVAPPVTPFRALKPCGGSEKGAAVNGP